MSPNFSSGPIDSMLDTQQPFSQHVPEPDVPFRIVVLGDFSHRGASAVSASHPKLSERRPVLIDRDNFDDVLARMGIELELPITGPSARRATLRIAELEDFHPDRIVTRVEALRLLDVLRARLSDPATFA